jgi:adenylate cyclase
VNPGDFGTMLKLARFYEGLLEGIVLAEIELTDADHKLTLPDWIGKEVTGDPTYRKINMVAARFAKPRFSDKTMF